MAISDENDPFFWSRQLPREFWACAGRSGIGKPAVGVGRVGGESIKVPKLEDGLFPPGRYTTTAGPLIVEDRVSTSSFRCRFLGGTVRVFTAAELREIRATLKHSV